MTDEQADGEWGLVVAFPDGSPSFVHGFEAGGIWERMRSGREAEIEITTQSDNREVLRRMAIAEGWTLESKPTEVEGWDYTVLTKNRGAPDRPNPHGLRVVKDADG